MAQPRPRVTEAQTFGSVKNGSFWVEYPSGLVDLTRSSPIINGRSNTEPPMRKQGQLDIDVDGDRKIRIDAKQTAIVIVDMQNFFLHPELRNYPLGLACVDPLLKIVPFLRKAGVRVIWLNWGLTPIELTTIPPALSRAFTRNKNGGFGSDLGKDWGSLLMRGARNADLYGPLHDEWLKGKEAGTDVWIHKNRMGGIWGSGTALELYLKEEGLKTLLFSGVNTDQCVLGTLVDAYFNGYDVVVIKDTTATPSPEGGLSNVLYNSQRGYGFVTDSERILCAAKSQD